MATINIYLFHIIIRITIVAMSGSDKERNMDHVLIIGINGTFGREVGIALKAAGVKVSALMRHPSRLPAALEGVHVIQGDVLDRPTLAHACEEVDTIIYGVNPPNYDWSEKAIACLEPVADMAERKCLTIVFPGNVYALDPADGPEFDEQAVQRPRTEKGEIRRAMEQRLQTAALHGAKVIILRMGDFIAKDSGTSWLPVLIREGRRGITLASPGAETLRRTWAYVPDAARVVIRLLQRVDELEAFNLFHFQGMRLSIRDIAEAMEDVYGKRVRIKPFPWWAIRLASPFSTLCSGLIEMRYLWNEELLLSDAKLRTFLHRDVPSTDIRTALTEYQQG